MSKRAKRLLSLLMALVMVMSLSTPAFALGGGREIGVGGGFGRDIGEDEIREFDPTDYEEEGEDPVDYFQTTDDETGITVTVASPFNALPTKAEVRLQPVDPESVREAVESVVEGQPNILVAMDISFWLDGQEIEPDQPVNVKISAPELTDVQNLQVVHIPDAGEEDAMPNTVELVTEEEMTIPVGTNEVAFRADSFSVYAVVGGGEEGDNARLAVNFFNLDFNATDPIATVYIKNSDLYAGTGEHENGKSYIEDIVYDPGIGEGYTLGNNMFRGWSIDAADANPQPVATEEDPDPEAIPYGRNYDRNTKVYTIEDITKYLSGRLGTIKEGDELNIYAMIFQTYTISYFGVSTDVSMGMHTVFAPLETGAEAPYTIDMAFTPDDNEHYFEGWMVLSGAENIVSAEDADGNEIACPPDDVNADEPTVFPNGTKLVVKGNVQFSVSQPAGRWLIFKENGKGATYNAPEFVKSGEITVRPTNAQRENMVRNGYDFVGWYELQVTYDENGRAVPVKDDDGNFVFASESEFVFGQQLTKETIIAAKWTPRTNSPYTVIIWQQNVSGDGYDFKEAIPFTGKTGDPITVVQQTGAAVVDYDENHEERSTNNVKVNNVEKAYEGFHVGSYDTQNDKVVRISAEGNTVVNVYYDRNGVLLRFNLYGTNTTYTEVTNPNFSYSYYWYKIGEQYFIADLVGGKYYYYEPIARNAMTHSSGSNESQNNTEYFVINNGQTYYVWYRDAYISGGWRYSTSSTGNGSSLPSNYQVYVRRAISEPSPTFYSASTSTGWYVYDTFYGLYGSSLVDGKNTWPSAYDWYSLHDDYGRVGGTQTTFLDAFLPASTSMSIDFWGTTTSGSYYIRFYKQNASKTDYELANEVKTDTDDYGHINFNLSDKYTGFQCVGYSTTALTDYSKMNKVGEIMSPEDDPKARYYDADPSQPGYQYAVSSGNLYIYFDRLAYPISYFDGVYVDGNGNVLDEDPVTQGFGSTDDITYGSDIKSYGNPYLSDGTTPNPDYKIPTRDGYVFDGWYADSSCSSKYVFNTMPYGGVSVYAKWVKIQFRVFLRPNVPTTDDSLFWGDEEQGMNFRITEGDYVSAPTGTRNRYVFVGWFLDEEFERVFNAEIVPLTRSIVTDDYDKTAKENMTDNYAEEPDPEKPGQNRNVPIKKWGELEPGDPGVNKDVNRFWITKKLDLYAKWKAILDGADGISVLYDEVPLKDGETDQHGHGVTGSAPTDGTPARLYEDNSKAIAQAASTALSEDEQFLYWVVQKWNGSAFVDADKDGELIKVYPGDNFTVLADYARIEKIDDAHNSYKVQLRAAYGPKDGPDPTHITWYSNIYDSTSTAITQPEDTIVAKAPTGEVYTALGFVSGKGYGFDRQGVQINKGIAIPTADTFNVPGYVFLGWGRVDQQTSETGNDPGASGNTEGVVALRGASGITDPKDLNEENLFLKWDSEKQEYQVKVSENRWVKVTQVACDEETPYHDMYAVWAPAFYVYHTGDNTVERVMMTSSGTSTEATANTFDLTELVDKSQYLYGGYYKSYSGVSPEFSVSKLGWSKVTDADALVPGEGTASTNLNNLVIAGKVSEASDLVGCTNYTGVTPTMFSEAYTQRGDKITPEAGAVYYIKEVPINDFLQPRLRYTYRPATGEIGTSWLFTNTDDESYSNIGFMIDNTIDGENNPVEVAADKYYPTITITALTTGNQVVYYTGTTAPGTSTDKITYTSLFPKGTMSYVMVYYNNDLYGDERDHKLEGFVNLMDQSGASAYMFWVTPDGMKVTSKALRSYSNLGTTSCTADKTHDNVSTITVYTAPTSGN